MAVPAPCLLYSELLRVSFLFSLQFVCLYQTSGFLLEVDDSDPSIMHRLLNRAINPNIAVAKLVNFLEDLSRVKQSETSKTGYISDYPYFIYKYIIICKFL